MSSESASSSVNAISFFYNPLYRFSWPSLQPKQLIAACAILANEGGPSSRIELSPATSTLWRIKRKKKKKIKRNEIKQIELFLLPGRQLNTVPPPMAISFHRVNIEQKTWSQVEDDSAAKAHCFVPLKRAVSPNAICVHREDFVKGTNHAENLSARRYKDISRAIPPGVVCKSGGFAAPRHRRSVFVPSSFGFCGVAERCQAKERKNGT